MNNLTAIELEQCWLAFANNEIQALQLAQQGQQSVEHQGLACPVYDLQSLFSDTSLNKVRYQAVLAMPDHSLALAVPCLQVKALSPSLVWFDLADWLLPTPKLASKVCIYGNKPTYLLSCEQLVKWLDVKAEQAEHELHSQNVTHHKQAVH